MSVFEEGGMSVVETGGRKAAPGSPWLKARGPCGVSVGGIFHMC